MGGVRFGGPRLKQEINFIFIKPSGRKVRILELHSGCKEGGHIYPEESAADLTRRYAQK
jgi:hypothetical protein